MIAFDYKLQEVKKPFIAKQPVIEFNAVREPHYDRICGDANVAIIVKSGKWGDKTDSVHFIVDIIGQVHWPVAIESLDHDTSTELHTAFSLTDH